MSLEQSEQEEGPGVFLSLSAQAPSSPFRGPPAAEASPRVSIKQEEGDLETCLSLQQPSQQQPLESPNEQQALAHAQEPHRIHTLDQSEAPYIENPLLEQKTVDSPEESRLSVSEEHTGHQNHLGALELEKSEYEQPSSSRMSSSVIVQGPAEQQRPTTTWLALAGQQRAPSCIGLLQQPKPSSTVGHLEHLKETSSFGSSSLSSDHDISEWQKPGLSLPVSTLSLQVSPKQEKHVGSAEEEKFTSSPESEKMPPLQPSLEQNSLFLHRPGVLSPQAEQGKDAPVLAQEHKAFFPSKVMIDQHNSTHLHNHPDQQKLSLPQQWHKSAFTQASVLQGPLDALKDASCQGPYAEQKFKFIQGHSVQQKTVSERKEELQVISQRQLLRPQQGFMLQSPPSVMKDQDALSRDKELNSLMESPLACLASPQGSENVYPAPLATHEAVLADRRLFMETLQSLHMALNSQVSLPKVEGVDLDLYKLYKEVTRRGGLEAVMKSGEWQDVVRAFKFPSNALNASYVLRKTYVSTLGHYEQVYFLGACGRSTPPAANTSQSPAALSEQQERRGAGDMKAGLHVMNGSTDSAQALGVDPASSVGAIVSGAIDGKFEDGYLVTVMVGARRMRGVLYHVASADMPPQNASVPTMMQSVSSEIQSVDAAPKDGRKRRKREVFKKDPNAPRQNRTGYNFFFAEQRAKLKTMQPDKDRAISKMIGELWSKLSEDEKSPYQVKGVKDKERYVKEMKEYKEKIKLPLIGGSNEVHTSLPLPSQLPYTHISHPLNDPKAVPPPLALTYVPQGSNNLKDVPPEPILSEAAQRPVTAPLPLPMVNTIMKTGEQILAGATSSNYSTAVSHSSGATIVNTTKAATIMHDPKSFSVSDPLVTPTVVDMSKFLVDETSPKSVPQSGSQAQSDALTETEEHVADMEH